MTQPEIEVYPLETPAMRAVEFIPAEVRGKPAFVVRDPAGVLEGTAVITPNPLLLAFLQLADGETTFAQMAEEVARATGQIVPAHAFESITKQLDEALLLQSERFRDALFRKRDAFLQSPVRKSVVFCAEGADRLQMIKDLADEMRRHRAGDSAPPGDLGIGRGSVAAILAPHIDYNRGGHTYAWAYRALRECGVPAKTWIVLGTCHQPSSHRFIATRKDFETPFGTLETDTALLDELAAAFGGELFRDEYAHAAEHTVELQAVYLRHAFGDGQVPKIVPLLVGSFEEFLENGTRPVDDPEVGAFCAALRKVLDVHGDSVGIIGGVDLSHCGPQFGDEELNGEEREKEIETGDRAALAAVETGDPDRFLDAFREDGNSRHVCSISTIYCVLEAMRGRATPRLLSYAQANSEDHACLVSFASVAFLRNGSQSPGARILIVPG